MLGGDGGGGIVSEYTWTFVWLSRVSQLGKSVQLDDTIAFSDVSTNWKYG